MFHIYIFIRAEAVFLHKLNEWCCRRSSSTNYRSKPSSKSESYSLLVVSCWHLCTVRDKVTERHEHHANQWLMLHSRLLVRVTWSAASWPQKQISAVSMAALIKHDPCSVPCSWLPRNTLLQVPKYLPRLLRAKCKTRDRLGGFSIKRVVPQRSWTHARLQYVRE